LRLPSETAGFNPTASYKFLNAEGLIEKYKTEKTKRTDNIQI
jgi:hypothetical protein